MAESSQSTYDSSMYISPTIGCGCAGCMSGVNSTNYNSEIEGNAGLGGDGVGAPSVTATTSQFADYLTDGFWQDFYGGSYSNTNFQGWGDSKTNFTFSIGGSYSAQANGIVKAFETWSDVADITFTRNDGLGSNADIYFDTVNVANNESGRAFAQVGWSISNDVATTVNPVRIVIDYASGGFGNNINDYGNYAFTTAMHEIGHALGLGHSGNYNAGSGNPSYNDATFTNDTHQFSIMSYWSETNFGGAQHFENPSTPMLMDIVAIQNLYGADMTTRTGNTTYGFNSNAGVDQFDFTINDNPVVAIWDAGGTDTLDLSGFSNTQVINLNDGEYSNVGGSTGNLAIALNATIENAVGGSGQDTIYGNEANNSIWGGNGNDTIHGSTGSDTLDGQGGTGDTVTYSYNISAFLVSIVNSVSLTLQHIADSWTDTISNIENFIFSGTSYTFAEMQTFDSGLGDIAFSFVTGTSNYVYNSTSSSQDTTLTAAGMNYNSGSGDMFSISRTQTTMTVNVQSEQARDFSMWADSGNDQINVTGTNSSIDITFYGRAGDDTLTIASGIVGNDIISLEEGDDTLFASGGNDQVWGGADNDTIYGEAGNDTINGGTGNDTIYGDNFTRTGVSGIDVLSGEAGEDSIYGGDGIDYIYGGTDNDIVAGDGGNDHVYGGDGADQVYGGAGDDRLYGDNLNAGAGDGGDTIYGNDGNDVVSAGGGNDTVFGGNDNDYLYGGAGLDNLQGESGNDHLYGGTGNDTLSGGIGDDFIDGQDDDDLIYGNNGDDILVGGAGTDTIYGDNINRTDTVGNDIIYGGFGADTIYGGDGDDTIYGDIQNANAGDGNDVVYGDAGNDVIVTNSGEDQLYGGTGNDQLWGGNDDDTFEGGAGNDVIQGGNGTDLVIYDNESAGIIVNLGNYFGIDGGGGYDTLGSIENVRGSGHNDTIVGTAGSNILWGQGGQDILYGSYGTDTIYGGAGNDIIYGDIQVGSGFDDDDIMYGEAGTDTLIGSGGNDTLNGGADNDTLWGGLGADTFVLALGSVDGIWDFNTGQNDRLDLSDILDGFYTNPGSQNIEDFVRITDSGANSIVSVDQDGGANNFVQVGTIYGVTGLTNETTLEGNGTLIV